MSLDMSVVCLTDANIARVRRAPQMCWQVILPPEGMRKGRTDAEWEWLETCVERELGRQSRLSKWLGKVVEVPRLEFSGGELEQFVLERIWAELNEVLFGEAAHDAPFGFAGRIGGITPFGNPFLTQTAQEVEKLMADLNSRSERALEQCFERLNLLLTVSVERDELQQQVHDLLRFVQAAAAEKCGLVAYFS